MGAMLVDSVSSTVAQWSHYEASPAVIAKAFPFEGGELRAPAPQPMSAPCGGSAAAAILVGGVLC